MSAPEATDWHALVDRFLAENPGKAALVDQARAHALATISQPGEFWEAVYTLIQQAVQMEGVQEGEA
jgi:hypothetical protein